LYQQTSAKLCNVHNHNTKLSNEQPQSVTMKTNMIGKNDSIHGV